MTDGERFFFSSLLQQLRTSLAIGVDCAADELATNAAAPQRTKDEHRQNEVWKNEKL